MGLPALRRDSHAHAPALRLLLGGRTQSARRSSRKRSAAADVAYQRRLFQFALVALLVVMGLGLARVQLTVQATEAALTAATLKADIESEQIRTEMLEADVTALATPSRIENIAEASMGMGLAEEVSYLELPAVVPDDEIGNPHAGPVASSATSERVAGVLDEVMRMTAGEMQVLLVGDAGIASSR